MKSGSYLSLLGPAEVSLERVGELVKTAGEEVEDGGATLATAISHCR